MKISGIIRQNKETRRAGHLSIREPGIYCLTLRYIMILNERYIASAYRLIKTTKIMVF